MGNNEIGMLFGCEICDVEELCNGEVLWSERAGAVAGRKHFSHERMHVNLNAIRHGQLVQIVKVTPVASGQSLSLS